MTPAKSDGDESREGVKLTNLDQQVFDGAQATKRDLVDYLDGIADRIVPVLRDRPLSVIRVHRGRSAVHAEERAEVHAGVGPDGAAVGRDLEARGLATRCATTGGPCCGSPTSGPSSTTRRSSDRPADRVTHLVLDLDPPEDDDSFALAVQAAQLVHQALDDAGLQGAVKTSGAKGLHVFVPVDDEVPLDDVGCRHPRHRGPGRAARPGPRDDGVHEGGPGRQGVPRRHPGRRRDGGRRPTARGSARACRCRSRWRGTTSTTSRPRDFTVHTAPDLLGDRDPWAERMPAPQAIPGDLIDEGHAIPTARVQAMHEGKRRARARRKEG